MLKFSSISIKGYKFKRKLDRCIKLPKRALGLYREYFRDANKLLKYYMYGSDKRKSIEYKILMDVHSLEKGMCMTTETSFGYKKCQNLLFHLNLYNEMYSKFVESSTPFLMGVAILVRWIEISEERGWSKTQVYLTVKKWIEANPYSLKSVRVGSYLHEYNPDNRDYDAIIRSRATSRLYSNRPLTTEDIEACVELTLSTPSACNRQMCKIYSFSNQSKKDKLSSVLTGTTGLDKQNIHYFVITYDIAALGGVGERNQGYFNSGLFAMNFVNSLHSRGIGTCFMQFDSTVKLENKLKLDLGISDDERIAVAIGAGYYLDESIIPCSQRKRVNEILVMDE
ncbi:nitroreductase family protein [Acetoanaerobium sticklandii]|uniref:nitroreductase family protein n=1 Tax=Acetoanaerobium sticklandii TaxID=1511 RepID=UPI003A8EB2EB